MINTYFAELEQLLLKIPYIQSYTIKKKIYNSKQGYIHTGEKECIEPSLEDVLLEIALLDRNSESTIRK